MVDPTAPRVWTMDGENQLTNHNGDVLDAIDARFDDLEDNVAVLQDAVATLQRIIAENGAPSLCRIDVDATYTSEFTSPSPLGPSTTAKRESEVTNEVSGITNIRSSSFAPGSPNTDKSEGRVSGRRITQLIASEVKDVDESILNNQTQEYYTFGESTWDLFMFIGTGALGPFGSFQTFLLAVVNVAMQIVFVGIAYFNFIDPEIDETTVQDATRWRRSAGHALSSYDEVSRYSLAERVCSLDKSLQESGIQMALYEHIGKYLKPDAEGFEAFFKGELLCIVALVCWYLMVAKEVSHALALHRSVSALPRGPTTLDTRENPFTKVTHYRLKAMGGRRKAISFLLLLYRLFSAALLVYVGTFFLVYTVDVTELILNAVALGIILDIDDLLFDALATTPGRHLVHQLDPLHMPSLPRWRGADSKSLFMTLVIPTLLLVVYVTMLQPMVGSLTEVQTAMCGGQTSFVWMQDQRRIMLMAPTFGGGWEVDDESVKTIAVGEAERIGVDLEQNDTKYAIWFTDVALLATSATRSLDEILDAENPGCGDVGNEGKMLNYLQFFLKDDSIRNCSDAKRYCTSITKLPTYEGDGGVGFVTRMLCPETCGCTTPAGEFMNVQGCSYGAQNRPCQLHNTWRTVRRESVCKERSAAELRDLPQWAAWVEQLRLYSRSDADLKGKAEAEKLAQAMWDYGCQFGANLTAEGIDYGSCTTWNTNVFEFEMKTLENICPETCTCNTNKRTTACPRPQGRTCENMEDCLWYQERHWCPTITDAVDGTFVGEILNLTVAQDHWASVLLGLQQTFAEIAGNGIEAGMVHLITNFPEERRLSQGRELQLALTGSASIFLIPDGLVRNAIRNIVFAVSIEDLNSLLMAKLANLSVPELGMSLSSFVRA